MNKGPVTLMDVAKLAGVSLATASRVINGSDRKVSGPLREQVMVAARQLHYVRNANAQALARSRSSIVGVIVHDIGGPYFSEVLRGIESVAEAAGRSLLVCNSHRDPAREIDYITLMQAHRASALIMTGSGLHDVDYNRHMLDALEGFTSSGGRAVLIGRHYAAGDAILPDNIAGGRAIAQHLLDLGHRNIGVIGGPPILTTSHDRLAGVRDAFSRAGVTLAPDHIVDGDFTRDSGRAAARTLLDIDPTITAILALDDEMAIGALLVMRERGIPVPEHISLCGFDDIPAAGDVTPGLSTVHVPLRDLGVRAMSRALHDATPEPLVESIPVELRTRASTGRPRPSA